VCERRACGARGGVEASEMDLRPKSNGIVERVWDEIGSVTG